jgi:hypothetical protein
MIGMPIKANVPMTLFINTHKDVHIVMQIRLVFLMINDSHQVIF